MVQIAILDELPERRSKSLLLSQQLKLPLIKTHQETVDFLLVYTKDFLELRQVAQKKYHPIHIDFLSDTHQFRQRMSGKKNELIARAVGIKPNRQLNIVDATAGFGKDALILAYLGCNMVMIERSPVLAALLQDAVDRGMKNNDFASLNIELVLADAVEYFTSLLKSKNPQLPDVVYLDPMFPDRKKSALVKKEMRMLQALIGKDENVHELFSQAERCAKKRVVVKRPKLAGHLCDIVPDIQFKGKACRFDVYLTHKM